MKRVKKAGLKTLLVLLCLVSAGSVLTFLAACDSGGGSGADFDATLYYTKTEVENYVESHVASVLPEKGTADALLLGGIGWAGRTTGFTVPAGATAVLVEVIAYNSGETEKGIFYMQFGPSSSVSTIIAEFILLPGEGKTVLGLAAVPAGASIMNGWHDTDSGHVGAEEDMSGVLIRLKPVLWFK